MKIKSCLLVGCGGIGSLLIEPLIRLLEYHENGGYNVVICDGDRYEQKNETRQLIGEKCLWRNKAKATARRLSYHPNLIYFPYYYNKATCDDILMYLMYSPPLIISAVDNSMTRHFMLNHLDSSLQSYLWISPSNGYSNTQVSFYYKTTNPPFPHPFERYQNLKEPTDEMPGGCENESVSEPQLITTNMLAAQQTLQYVTSLLDGQPVYQEVIGDIYGMRSRGQGEPVVCI